MTSKASTPALSNFFAVSFTAYARELKKRLGSGNLSDEMLFSIEFNGYGAAGVILDWIENDMFIEPYCLAQNIANNMPENMKRYFQ